MQTIIAVDVLHANGPSEPTRYFVSEDLAREVIPPNDAWQVTVIYTTIPVYDWRDSWDDMWRGKEKQKELFIAERAKDGRV
jgi:hypothetical protein